MIGKALQLFITELVDKTAEVTLARNAKTLTKSHIKSCVMAHDTFDFLKDAVKDIPEHASSEDKPKRKNSKKRKADAAEPETVEEGASPSGRKWVKGEDFF